MLNILLIIGGVVIALVIVGVPVWSVWKANKLKQIVEGKVYVTTILKSGTRINGLYPAGAYSVSIKRKEGKGEKTVGAVLTEKNTFNMLYPPHEGTKNWLAKVLSPTVTVQSIVKAEGNGAPWSPFATEPEIMDDHIQAIKEEAFTERAMRAGREWTSPGASGKFPLTKMQILVGTAAIYYTYNIHISLAETIE